MARDGAASAIFCTGAQGVALVALFSPEHGIRGALDDAVPVPRSETRARGIPIYSLYGATRRPDRRNAGWCRHARDRSAGCRGAVLHVCQHDGLRDGGISEAEYRRGRARSTQSHRRLANRGTSARSRRARLHRLFSMPPSCHGLTIGELRVSSIRRTPSARINRSMDFRAGRATSGSTQPDSRGRPIAQHRRPDRGDTLPGSWEPSKGRISLLAAAPIRRSSKNRRAVGRRRAAGGDVKTSGAFQA